MKGFIEIRKTYDQETALLSVDGILSVEKKKPHNTFIVCRGDQYFFTMENYDTIKAKIEEASK